MKSLRGPSPKPCSLVPFSEAKGAEASKEKGRRRGAEKGILSLRSQSSSYLRVKKLIK